MQDLSDSISKLVDGFVQQVTVLARKAAMDTLSVALSGDKPARGGRPAVGPATVRRAAPVAGKPGAKRPAEDLARLKDQLAAYIQENPGSRIEQIGKALGYKTKELALPVKKLIAEGAVKTEGEKRATAYSPAGGKRKKAA
jgi:hypothetical protein